jgi:EmrB/QacA subfamily drug resistance transporter
LDATAGRVVVAMAVLGSSVAMLTATVVNVALPRLAIDLDASSAGQKWVVNGYTLTLASLILIGGALGDRFGRVRLYRIGVAWFALASLACAVAWNVESLIVFRMLQGIGGALLTPGSLAIIQATLRESDRGRGVGAWSGIGGIAGAIGPLLGGLLVDISWRWVFLVNLPVAAAALVLSFWVPETSDPSASDSRLDLGGALLTAVVLGAASYALIEGPEGGFSALEVAAVVVAVIAALWLWFHERGRDHAMLPLDLFGDRTFSVVNGLTFAVYGGMGVVFFLMSLQLQVTAGWTPLAAGTAMLPVTLIMLLLSSRSGELATRIGARLPLTVGPIGVALGMLLMIRIGPDASFVVDVLPATIVFGLGLALIVAPITSTALAAVPDERVGSASGVNNAVARTAGLLSVAAIPGLVGLNGDALSDPLRLGPGFERAMVVSAVIVGLAGLVAFVLLPRASVSAERCTRHEEEIIHRPCPVDGAGSSVETPVAAGR